MSAKSQFSRIAALPELLGEAFTGRWDMAKALLAFTPVSRVLRQDPKRFDAMQRELVFLGLSLLAVYPGPMLGLARDIAMLAEGLGKETAFRKAMTRALRDAERIEGRLSSQPKVLKDLVDFHVSLMDFSAAHRVLEKARTCGADSADDLSAYVDAVEADCDAWRPVVGAAHRALMARIRGDAVAPQGEAGLTLHIPVAAFRRNVRDYPGFREDIRRAFRQIVATLVEKGIDYRVDARLAKHGTPRAKGPFIAYHTVCDASDGLHVKETDRRSYFSADTHGYSGWAGFSRLPLPSPGEFDRNAVADFIAGERQHVIEGNQSKYDQSETESLPDTGKPYVLVALQIIDDAVQRLSDMHMFDMLEEVTKACAKRNVAVVVKRHPLCRSGAVGMVLKKGARRGLFTVSTGSIHRLIANSCAVCVVNSGTGAEALLHGKPVYTFGAAEYQAATFQVRQSGQFEVLFEPGRLPADPLTIEDFLYALRHRYSVNLRDEEQAMAFWTQKLSELPLAR